MAFIYAYFFSDFLRFDMSLLLLTVTLRGVSNKHCLLSLFSFEFKQCGLTVEKWLQKMQMKCLKQSDHD